MKIRNAILQSKYFYLLFALISFFIISPFLVTNQISNIILSILFSFVIVLSVNIIARRRLLLVTSIFLGIISIIGYWLLNLAHENITIHTIHFVVNILFLTVITYSVISSVAQHRQITVDTLFGAICGYLLLGLTWTYIYLSIISFNNNAFSDHTPVVSIRDQVQHFIYYSFETLTTLGYGDILALSDVARTFSWLEAVTGQIYIAVWISQLVGLRIAQIKRN